MSLARFNHSVELGETGILRPGRLRWLRALGWLVCFTFLIVLSFGPFTEAVTSVLPTDAHALRFAARLSGALVALIAYYLLVRFVERRSASELAIKAAPGELTIGVLLGVVTFATVMAILVVAGLYEVKFIGANPAWSSAGAAIEAGIVEELIIRGVILRLLWRAFGPTVAFAVSAALFGLGHLPNSGSSLFAAFCIALEAGVMLGAFYALTGRLWVSIGFHMAWNFTQGYVFGASVSGGSLGASMASSAALPGAPEWLSGGAFGPEASFPALVVCSLLGFLTLWAAWKAGQFNGEQKDPNQDRP